MNKKNIFSNLFISILVLGTVFFNREKLLNIYKTAIANILGKNLMRVAHSGGGLNKLTYTNSIDALEANANHYEFFEIDLLFTKDRKLICTHDWEGSIKETKEMHFNQIPPTIDEFEQHINNNKKYKNCTFKTLAAWLQQNPNKKIITDAEGDNIAALTFIAKEFPNYQDRFIPQIYYPDEYEPIKKMGFKKIIWTLYCYQGSSEDVIKHAKSMDLYAITMPTGRAQDGLAKLVAKKLGIPSYVHTINTQEELEHYNSLGISEIYTDFLPKN